MIKKLTLALLLSALPIASYALNPVIDITRVANKDKSEVDLYLGIPEECEKIKYGTKCSYSNGHTEVIFINKKADWITVEDIDAFPFSAAALESLSLKEKKPSFSNNFVLRWELIEGLKEVSIFKGTNTSDYAYIKVKTN